MRCLDTEEVETPRMHWGTGPDNVVNDENNELIQKNSYGLRMNDRNSPNNNLNRDYATY